MRFLRSAAPAPKAREPRPIRALLVANRGEIAVRIIRTARDMGITSIAVYSDQDMRSQACDLADIAVSLGGAAPAATYLSTDAILKAAKKADADAVHPGYGFLSENADFAEAVINAGLTWLGPSPQAIRALGDKISARRIAEKAHVPVIPGGPLPKSVSRSRDLLLGFGAEHGYPILVKKADAGGGRGITRFDSDEDVHRWAKDLPGRDALVGCFVEKMVTRARHVETQCARDSLGAFEVVTTRDCSVQRRNQKVVEEAPAPHLPAGVEEALTAYSRQLFAAVDYVGVGTCEFLVTADGRVYFLEVNPRLQVEHTVSEEVAGIDLVREQIRIAEGKVLTPLTAPRGHSFEVRITSENPADELMPTTGRINAIQWPGGPGVRVDSFVRVGDSIGSDFDSLIAKLIVTGPTRAIALARLLRAIDEFTVEGLPTSSPLLVHILTHPDFCGPDSPQARANGADLPEHARRWPNSSSPFGVYTKWMEDLGLLGEVKKRLGPASAAPSATGASVPASVADEGELESFTIEVDGRRATLKLPQGFLGRPRAGAETGVPTRRRQLRKRGRTRSEGGAVKDSGPSVHAPIQATVVRLACEVGQVLAAGDLVVVLESMKMEKPILAQTAGRVTACCVAPGDTVKAGDLLVQIDPEAKEDE